MEGQSHDNSSSLFTQAINATCTGNESKLEELCKAGLSVDMTDHNGETLLIIAASWGQLHIVRFLVHRRASLDVVDQHLQQTALIRAARIGQKSILKCLIDNGASLDALDHLNHTALMKAAASKHPDCVQLLVQGGASVDVQDGSGFTALMKAARIGNLAIVRTLVEKGASLDLENVNGNTALKIVAGKRQLGCVRYLLEKGARISRAGDELIKVALHWHRKRENPRRLAKDLECIQRLVRAGAKINAAGNKGDTVFHLAAAIGFLECVNYLLGLQDLRRDAINDDGETALMLAAKTPFVGVVEACVRRAEVNVDVNMVDLQGYTAIMHAARCNRPACVKVLAENGANPNVGVVEACVRRAEVNVDVNMVDLQGYTAIMHAARCNQPACVKVLAENGANPNVVDDLRWTPLMWMAHGGHVDCVRALVCQGALVDFSNAGGETALDMASRVGCQDVVEFLKEKSLK